MGLEPTTLLTASQALYQLSYAPGVAAYVIRRPGFPRLRTTVQRPYLPSPSARRRPDAGPTRAEWFMAGSSIAA